MVDVDGRAEDTLLAASRVKVAPAEDPGFDHLPRRETGPEDGVVWEDEPPGAVSLRGLGLFGQRGRGLFRHRRIRFCCSRFELL